MSISVTIITRNEQESISRCLESVSWADEVIVVDSGSSDATASIARDMGATVVVSDDWLGFGPQKNRALDLASGDWIFSIDADEIVTPELAAEIRATVASNPVLPAYQVPRLSSYCGRYLHHSGWWPDYVTRLFRRGQARFSDDLVHERVVVDGSTGKLKGTLLHESFGSFEDVLEKVNRYSSLSAQQMAERGRTGGLAKGIVHGIGAFLKTYVLKAGFLDGREGFMLAVSNAEGAYYKYVKLYLLNRSR
jgi:glycosyltransferase involved in cell wall biosynthesis